ncbi:MAG: chloride channel protein, partial [Rhodospirillales bacterium]|nr:chloride channel protein [Rhodospirillales bacterium]
MVYGAEDAFQRLPLHWMYWPMIGGLVVGLGGLIDPRALGVGYTQIDALLAGRMAAGPALELLVVKAAIWAIALGSGTSGGVLAPLLIMGGCAGALASLVLPHASPGDWALIGMAATMGGTMRAPLTAMMFAVELTGDAALSVPLIAACGAATAFTVLLLKRSILTEKLARRGHHIVREYTVDPFDLARVGEVMVGSVDTLPASMTLAEMAAFFTDAAPRHKAYPVLDEGGRPVAMATRADALRLLAETDADPARREASLGAALSGRDLVRGFPEEPVTVLANRMVARGVGRVPVVRAADGVLVGLVARKDLLTVRARVREEETGRQAFLGLARRVGSSAVELEAAGR